MEKSLSLVFEEIHNSRPDVVSSAPGRISIIGEHTDYNQGYVLPAAINLRNYFFLSKRTDEKVCIWTEDFKKREMFSLQTLSLIYFMSLPGNFPAVLGPVSLVPALADRGLPWSKTKE